MATSRSSANGGAQGGLDTAKLLVQRVARQFYGVRGAILADQLIKKEVFRDEEIAKRLGMQPKDVAKIAHRLVEDQVVQVHRRSEMRDNGMAKAQLRTYYYLDYSKATDVIKWRMWKIQQTIDVKLRNELDAQGYVCPLCKASYTPLDAAGLFDPMRNLLACSICGTEVINNENEEDVKGNKDRMQRLNRQTKSIVDLLKGLEKVEVPRFNVETYLAIHGPALGATAQAAAEAAGSVPAQAAVVKVHLAGDDDEAIEKAKRERDAELKRQQNALPSWIAQSTISSDPNAVGGASSANGSPAPPSTGEKFEAFSSTAIPGLGATMRFGDEDAKPAVAAAADDGAADTADLDAYYASLAAEPSVEPSMEPEDRFDSPSVSLAGTPALRSPTIGTEFYGETPEPVGAVAAAVKREREESSEAAFGEDPAKRSRFEDSPSVAAAVAVAEEEEDFSAPPSEPAAAPAGVEGTAEPEADEDDYEDDEFEEEGGAGADPNQLISVNGKMMPFSEVTEEMTGEMTADEYSAYWEVYQQVNG
ncbi:hypothetical protein JCM11251_001572 [Rhodosporidiobolus azoricus]